MAQNIRIRLKAFDHEIIDQSTRKIVETVTLANATIRGPIQLPGDKHRYTVIRGPHIDKDSREHFEMRVHKRLIDIVDPNPKSIDGLQRIKLPAGVDIEMKIQSSGALSAAASRRDRWASVLPSLNVCPGNVGIDQGLSHQALDSFTVVVKPADPGKAVRSTVGVVRRVFGKVVEETVRSD